MIKPRPGVALLSALLTLGLVIALASHALWQGRRTIAAESAARDAVAGRWLLDSAIVWAAQRVREDGLLATSSDHLGEPWAQPVRNQAPEGVWAGRQAAAGDDAQALEIDITIEDAQARINLLNLIEGASISPVWMPVFIRLFEQLGLPREELDRLSLSLLRASAGTAQAGPAPLMPQRVDDLPWLGLSLTSAAVLKPHLSVLPGRLGLNLNTAGLAALRAAIDLPEEAARSLIARRQGRPFATLADAGLSDRADTALHTVSTRFFEVVVQVRAGSRWTLHSRALLQRQGGEVRVLWRA